MASRSEHPITVLLIGWLLPTATQANAVVDKTSAAPVLPADPVSGSGLLQMGFGLFVVLALILALAWMMRRLGGVQGGANSALRILGGLSLGTRERVVLVQVGEQQVLLGVAPGRVQTLHVLEQPIAVNEHNKPATGSFAASLSAALQRGKTT